MSKATKVVTAEEKQKEMQLADQIKKIPQHGTKYLIAQLQSQDELPEDYGKAIEEELKKRGVTEMPPKPVLSSAHAQVEVPPVKEESSEGEAPQGDQTPDLV